ncbi:MAG: HD family phosphohydrolase [Phycisphaerae bacterium]
MLGWPLVIAAAFWALATFIVISGDEPLTYSVGQILKRPVLSRVDFQRINQFQTEELRRKTRQGVPNYFRLDKALVDTIQAEFRDLHAAVKASENFESYQKTNPDRWELDEQAFTVLKSVTDQAGSEQFKRNVDALASRLINEEMIERAEVERDIRSTASNVMIDRGDGVFRPVPKERLNYASNPRDVEELASRLIRYVFPDEIRQVLENIIIQSISPKNKEFKPLYVFDAAYTKERLVEADHVEPVMDKYKAGDRMIKAGKIDREALALLKIEHQEYLKQRSVNAELRAQWRNKRIGLLGVIMLVTIGLTIFTIHTQPRIVHKAPRSLAVAGLLLLMLLFERFILLQVTDSPIWSVTAVTMTAAILTIAYSQVFAFGATSALAILSVLALSAPYSLIIVLLSATTITVLMLREVRTRLKMLAVGAITAAVASFSALLIALSDGQDVGADVVYAAPAALAGLILVNILLPVIEMAFRITTSQTLLEWADTSQPIQRQLLEKAPGTFQHSQLLGSMAETAAEEIGANGLLARVGAYYHDIGKICKPHYFAENQEARINAHTGLAPTMSLLVILAHVKDGLALAREHRLPPVLHHFIAEHHGTTVVKYFHTLATQEAKSSGQNSREISDTEFRYPGPKPRSRETAILMLCDGVEGAVRSLQDPTSGRIEAVVHEILMARLMDGQFDDCDITLKELAKVEQSLVKSLRAIHHGRVAYPTAAEPSSETQAQTA